MNFYVRSIGMLTRLIIAALLFVVGPESFGQWSAKLQFIENKGQWEDDVQFKGELSNGAFFLTNSGFTVVQHNAYDLQRRSSFHHGQFEGSTSNEFTLRSHAYAVNFLGASPASIYKTEQASTYNNYFIGNDPSKWAGDCKIFQAITYRNMYPGIDVKYYSAQGKAKYDILIGAGADISKVKMQYSGADKLELHEGNLIIKTSVGDIREVAPYAYQLVDGQEKQLDCNFKITDNVVSFETASFDHTRPLVIDPTLVFSTFTGSIADNWGYTGTYGPDGSAFAAGIVFGTGYPVNTGAFAQTFAGGSTEGAIQGYDIGIMKFSSDGTNRVYATYLGGASNEAPLSLIADGQGNLIIASRTRSSNFPTTMSTYGAGGNYDLAITKLNATGTSLLASRKFGGSANDGVSISLPYSGTGGTQSILRNYNDHSRADINLDVSGNIYIVSCTNSSNFPFTTTAIQKSLSGTQDGVFLQISNDLSTVGHSTYFGGSGDDALFSLAIDNMLNTVYLAGSTTSTNLPGDKTGVLYNTFNGGPTDGFIAVYSAGTITKSTFLGTSGADMLYYIACDNAGYPYVTGTSTVSLPVINAPFNQVGGKQFIAKLQPDLSAYVYCTNFGTNSSAPNLSPSAFGVDCNENVYLAGWGGKANSFNGVFANSGTNGLVTTANAIQTTTDGSDYYFFAMSKNAASQLYGSFFGKYDVTGAGADHIDGSGGRISPAGILYQPICADCGNGGGFPTTPGAWSLVNGSSSCNQALVKLSFDICNNVFPVRLQSFTGRVLNKQHELSWQVSNEEKGDSYILERSTSPNSSFISVYTTKANSSANTNSYSASFNIEELSGSSYYRLKTLPNNGDIKYSSIVRLKNDARNKLDVHVSQGSLQINLPAKAKRIIIFTTDGRVLYEKSAGLSAGILNVPINRISKGVLILRLQAGNQVMSQRVVL